jgi:hypothetical protein
LVYLLKSQRNILQYPSFASCYIRRSEFYAFAVCSIIETNFCFLYSAITQLVRRLPHFKVSRSHTIRDTHTLGMTPLNKWSARRNVGYLHNTQRKRETNINAPSGIRTGCLDDQTAAIDRMATWSPISISWVRSHKGMLRTLRLNAKMWSISCRRSKK